MRRRTKAAAQTDEACTCIRESPTLAGAVIDAHVASLLSVNCMSG